MRKDQKADPTSQNPKSSHALEMEFFFDQSGSLPHARQGLALQLVVMQISSGVQPRNTPDPPWRQKKKRWWYTVFPSISHVTTDTTGHA